MSDSVKLADGARLARTLRGSSTETEEDLRNRVAREFFGEEGIPAHLAEGWAVFDDWRTKRAEAGYPVPPGGVLVTGYSSAIAAVAAELHTRAAAALKLEARYVRVVGVNKELRVRVVDPPISWILPEAEGVTPGDESSYQKAVQAFVNRETEGLRSLAMLDLVTLCTQCTLRRADLDPEVAPVRSR